VTLKSLTVPHRPSPSLTVPTVPRGWTLSGIGQYMTICTGQLVEFLGRDFQSSGPCYKVFFINKSPNNYSKVTNVDRNEPRGFYRLSKLTYFLAFWHILSFFELDFRINIFKNHMFRITSTRAFDWCMNCNILVKIFFFHFLLFFSYFN
jgi:hypothetical protein